MKGSYGRMAGEVELARTIAILDWSFAGRLAWGADKWLASMGHDTARVFRDADGVVQAALCLLPMGQFFGGRRVAMGGIAGVGTAAERRGGGASSACVRGALEELRRDGVPLSALYPASFSLYRRSGFEIAGAALRYSVAARDIDVRDRALDVRPVAAGDAVPDEVAALYLERARREQGNLDRGPQLWGRVLSRRGAAATGFGVWEVDALEGYVYVLQTPGTGHPYDLELTDVQARSARGWRRILTFLRDHGSLGAKVRWFGAPADPIMMSLAEEVCAVEPTTPWMLRLVDVDRALSERGWPPGLTGELALDVRDDVLPANTGPRVLTVAAGRAEVRPGGGGGIRLDVRVLAQLYSGYATASALARLGRVEGDPAALETADALFGAPHPWMSDMF